MGIHVEIGLWGLVVGDWILGDFLVGPVVVVVVVVMCHFEFLYATDVLLAAYLFHWIIRTVLLDLSRILSNWVLIIGCVYLGIWQ